MAVVTTISKGGQALTVAEADNNMIELRDKPEGQVYPKEREIGIRVDTDSPDFGWHDMVGQLFTHDHTGTPSEHVPYRGFIGAEQFDEGDEAFCSFHMPHDYLMGSPIYVHVHWSHISDKITSGSCTWGFDIMYAKGHDQAIFEEPITIVVNQEASTQPYKHLIAETVASDVGGSGTTLDTNELEVDGIIQLRLFLDSNDIVTSDDSEAKPFAHFVDFHYQSTNLPTKNKSPNFWE